MSNTIPPTKRISWFGTTFWIVVGGLLLLNISVFVECFDPLTIQQCLFRLDFRYWLPGLACPLWLIVVLLVIDSLTFRQHRTESGKWKRRFETVILAVKVGFVICIAYLFLDAISAPPRRSWQLLWYAANIPIYIFFVKKWLQIYQTRSQTNVTPEIVLVQTKFLIMSITVAGELSIFNVLFITGLNHLFSYPLWRWFGFGAYSHWAAAAFFFICFATGLTFFVFKEWLMAIRQVRRVNKVLTQP